MGKVVVRANPVSANIERLAVWRNRKQLLDAIDLDEASADGKELSYLLRSQVEQFALHPCISGHIFGSAADNGESGTCSRGNRCGVDASPDTGSEGSTGIRRHGRR